MIGNQDAYYLFVYLQKDRSLTLCILELKESTVGVQSFLITAIILMYIVPLFSICYFNIKLIILVIFSFIVAVNFFAQFGGLFFNSRLEICIIS